MSLVYVWLYHILFYSTTLNASVPFSIGPFCMSVLLSAVSEADSMIKVAEWQQTYYASDSGIHSGATTVRDDESSTDYSGRKKYSGGGAMTAATVPGANAIGGGEPASGTLESPTGEKVIILWVLPSLRGSFQ